MKRLKSMTGIVFCLFFLFGSVDSANALIHLIGDKLTMSGFLRTQFVLSVGSRNPALSEAGLIDDNLDSILFRVWFEFLAPIVL